MFRVRLSVKTSNIVGNTSMDFQVDVQGKVFTESLTLNIYLEVQTGVSHYVTSFYRKSYPEHLSGSPYWCFLLCY
jgi:hypothetical protein